MKKIIVLLIFIQISCKTSYIKDKIIDDKAEYISLISIIANPEKYHNKKVIVDGYFTLEKEG